MPQHADGEVITVQFAPCGHISSATLTKYFQMGGHQEQLDRIEAGTQLDAAILHSSTCPDCNTPGNPEIADLYAQDDAFWAEMDSGGSDIRPPQQPEYQFAKPGPHVPWQHD